MPVDQQQVTFLGSEQGQARERLRGILHDAVQQQAEVCQQALDGGLLKEIGRVSQGAAQAPGLFGE